MSLVPRASRRSRQRGVMLANPYRYVRFPLDSYTTGLWSACALVRLLTSWTGSLIRVRRSSDNSELDIGFVSGALDTAALATFVGSDSAYVVKWYDQSGAGNDFANATTSTQPRIVNAGVYDAKIVFNVTGVTTMLVTANSGAATLSKSIFRKVNLRSPAATNISFEYGNASAIGGGSGASQIQFNATSSSAPSIYIAQNGGAGYSVSGFTLAENGTPMCVNFTRGLSPGYLGINICRGSTNQIGQAIGTSTYNGGAGCGGGNFPSYPWRIGCRTDGYGAQIDMWSCVIYDADKSADAVAINALLA